MYDKLRLWMHYLGMLSMTEETKADRIKNRIYFVAANICGTSFFLASVTYLMFNAKTFEEVILNCCLELAAWQAYCKYLCIIYHSKMARSVLDELGQLELDSFFKPLAKKIFYMRTFAATSASFFYAINNFFIVKIGSPYRVWLPYDNHSSETVYFITSFFLFLNFAWASVCFCTVESFTNITLIYITAHFVQLQDRFRKIGQRDSLESVFNDDEICLEIKECIKIHQNLLSLIDRICLLISILSSIQFCCLTVDSVFTGVAVFKELNAGNYGKLADHAFFLSTILVMGSTNYILADNMQLESTNVAFAVYDSEWPNWSTSCKKLSKFVIARCQIPLSFTILGFFSFSRETYFQMLTNCFSVFTLIRDKL